jgi:cytosine/adenosine deaminase-related metal-dependent hydrolase
VRTKLKSKYIIAYNGWKHVYLIDGELVYEGTSIIYVGKNFAGTCEREIDYGTALISPGFIDLDALGDIDHWHISSEQPNEMTNSLLWSSDYYEGEPHDSNSPEDEAFKSLYAYAALVRNGITTAMPITSVLCKKWAETYEEIEAAAHHSERIGLRVYLGPSYQAGMRVVLPDGKIEVRFKKEEGRKGLERAIHFAEEFDGKYDGLINAVLVPERIETQTIENLIASKKAADELKCPIRLHAAQGAFEYAWIREHNGGKTPIQLLNDIGFLGNRTLIPHVLYTQGYSDIRESVPGDDVKILADTQTTGIHCPVVYARSGTALESFSRYRKAGVNLAMGTDTFPPSMLENIKIGSYMARRVARSPEGNRFSDFFEAATLGGARALGREDLGRLAPGAKADIVVFDMSGIHIGPIHDPLRTLVNGGSSRDIITVIINGRTVLENGKICGIDENDMIRGAQAYSEKMTESYLERDYLHHTKEELFPMSFDLEPQARE